MQIQHKNYIVLPPLTPGEREKRGKLAYKISFKLPHSDNITTTLNKAKRAVKQNSQMSGKLLLRSYNGIRQLPT